MKPENQRKIQYILLLLWMWSFLLQEGGVYFSRSFTLVISIFTSVWFIYDFIYHIAKNIKMR
jgi:hypothetical protein